MTVSTRTAPPPRQTVDDPILAMFPGQGSQRAGMAAHLLERHGGIAGPIFATADAVAGFGLTELCVSGAKAELTRTEVTQLAVVATSIAAWEVLRASGFRPAAVAGHSLGEFSALVAAQVLSLEAALALVARRGELMARVARSSDGGMLAVIGLGHEVVERLCAERRVPGVAEVANYNDPRQVVVSGHRDALAEVAEAATAAGAEKVVMLEVGAPFHSSLMAEIEVEFAAELARYPFGQAEIPVISSVTGTRLGDGAQARQVLRTQLAQPVRWTGVLGTAGELGFADFVEIGPGRVLTGFVKNTFEGFPVSSTGDDRRLDGAIRAIRKVQERNQS
ncbi:ACP S-malonyltransferase [Nocardia sp. NPDC057663]|uniref:ACP S-malonyltransferase n=1 Tax=Nocardia sp. NPDC057663 TaxID=3346201 RepID=UPI0036724B28